MAGVGEDDVGNGEEGIVEGGVRGSVDVEGRFLDTDADHGYQTGGDDGDESCIVSMSRPRAGLTYMIWRDRTPSAAFGAAYKECSQSFQRW